MLKVQFNFDSQKFIMPSFTNRVNTPATKENI